jgi:signal transduction histidine kinase
MSSGPISRGGPGPARPGSWVADGLIASGRGVGLTGLILAEAGMLCALALAVTFAGLGFGLLLIPGTLLVIRRLANRTRRLAGEWCGVGIAVPYLPQSAADGAEPGFWRRFGRLLTDQATWRDLLWMTVDSMVGWILTLAPISLVGYGLFGIVMPAVWSPIVHAGGNQWYAMIDVSGPLSAWLCVPLGVVFVALGLWAGPRLLRAYGRFARSLLAPTRQAELALRVRHLTESRTDVVDTRAAEVRRIERDLHDGAQARLVAMGMTLGAAERVLDDNPAAARALLIEARNSSAKALAELRDLVRGIHPPVLADRGLGDAIRALALDSPMKIHLVADLPGRPEAPVESAAYFAVCELLANVAKHAHAREVWIDIRYERGLLRIDVADDGRGGADVSRGSGLSGIERRLATFDGILALSSPPGGPTVVTMELPCELSSPKTSSS